MSEWANREQRQADAGASYEEVMTTPRPPATAAYIDAGVVGFVFGEMWRRGVLTGRDRRWITLSCLGAADSVGPIQSHVWAAFNSGDVNQEEFDEFVLLFATQCGWPKGSVMHMYGIQSAMKLAEQRGETVNPIAFEPWTDPVDDAVRRARGEASYLAVHGVPPDSTGTAFRDRAYLDYLYGEVWTRDQYLSRRDRLVITISCCGALGVSKVTRGLLRAALATEQLTYGELQELVMHVAVYSGWPRASALDDLLVDAAHELSVA